MVRKLSDKGVTRAVTGSTGSNLCFMFCLLHSQQGSGPCFDEWFHCRQQDYSQNQLPPICGYRYLHMTFIQNVSVWRHSAVLWGRLQCWCCFSMSFVGISTMSFCQHLLCVFGFIYMKLNIAFRHRHLAVEQELGLPLCLFLESLEFSRLQWSHQVLVQVGVWQTKAEILCSQMFWCSALFAGGLLICLPREQAARFCAEIKSPKYGEGHQAWIIGIVEKGNRTARIIDKPRIIEVAPQVATQNVNPTPGATS